MNFDFRFMIFDMTESPSESLSSTTSAKLVLLNQKPPQPATGTRNTELATRNSLLHPYSMKCLTQMSDDVSCNQ